MISNDCITMKTNIFIASSSELKRERFELVDLMLDINQEPANKANGIKLEPVLWEYMDSSMRAQRKEDEYLAELRKCELCIVLFWNILGEYTLEELDVAVQEMNAGNYPPKVFVFFKEPAPTISEGLADLKAHFGERYPSVIVETFDTTEILRRKMLRIVRTIIRQ